MSKVADKKKSSKSKKQEKVNDVVVENTGVVESTPSVVENSSTVVENSTTIVESSPTEEESNIELLFTKMVNQFQDVQSVMKTLHNNLKVMQKEISKQQKELRKKENKKKNKSDKKKPPSGFAKPTPISNELSNFLNLNKDDEIARTEVTSKVIAYIKEHNLQNPENKKTILLDEKLKLLLEPGDNVITFFNLQTYLKKHFLPSATTTTDVTTVAPTDV